jgi:hypothetical protein
MEQITRKETKIELCHLTDYYVLSAQLKYKQTNITPQHPN